MGDEAPGVAYRAVGASEGDGEERRVEALIFCDDVFSQSLVENLKKFMVVIPTLPRDGIIEASKGRVAKGSTSVGSLSDGPL